MPWSTPFDEPIARRGARNLATLQHAADYIMKLPDNDQQREHWQIAIENLINAAETGGGWLMFARIAMLRALNADGKGRQRQTGLGLFWRLFQGAIDRRKFEVELGADALNSGDDRKRDTARNQAIFDGGGAGLITQES